MFQFRILWLDANSSDPMSSFRIKLGDAETFTDINGCIQYIQSHPDQSIYLIISGSFARDIVPKIYDSSNVIQIFLFCGSVKAYAEWGLDYCDKMMIFDHGDDLLERLWNHLHANLQEQAALCFKFVEMYKQRVLQYKRPCG